MFVSAAMYLGPSIGIHISIYVCMCVCFYIDVDRERVQNGWAYHFEAPFKISRDRNL